MTNNPLSPLVEGRACGTCTLCCKVYPVPVLDKPAGTWCTHCSPGRGCGIWESRPDFCRQFFCNWMMDPTLGPEWKPERARFVLNYQDGGRQLTVMADPGSPDAWRREPYLPVLRRFAARLMEEGRIVMAQARGRALVVLPDGEVDVGPAAAPGPFRLMRAHAAGGGSIWRVESGAPAR